MLPPQPQRMLRHLLVPSRSRRPRCRCRWLYYLYFVCGVGIIVCGLHIALVARQLETLPSSSAVVSLSDISPISKPSTHRTRTNTSSKQSQANHGGVEKKTKKTQKKQTETHNSNANNTNTRGAIQATASASALSKNIDNDPPVGSPYAYAFIVGSVHDTNIAYKGFLWNVLLAVQMLRRLGSTADFVVYWQLAPDAPPPLMGNTTFDELRYLQALGVHTYQLDQPTTRATFSDLMFDKFQVLKLTHYRRVLYLDADVLPIGNLDYLFHLSDPEHTSTPTLLQPYIMQATGREPANGGVFMVRPFPDAWSDLQSIIARQKEEGKRLPYPSFHKYRGWGHHFNQAGDCWHAVNGNGTHWKFHGGFADQGLLFYLLKYQWQQVSAVVGSKIMNWSPGVAVVVTDNKKADHDDDSTNASSTTQQRKDQLLNKRSDGSNVPHTQQDHPNPILSRVFSSTVLSNYSKHLPALAFSDDCASSDPSEWKSHTCFEPYRSYVHYTGKKKPWQRPFQQDYLKDFDKFPTRDLDRVRLWFWELHRLNQTLQMGLDFEHWNEKYLKGLQKSPLGYFPLLVDNYNRIFEDARIEETTNSSSGDVQ